MGKKKTKNKQKNEITAITNVTALRKLSHKQYQYLLKLGRQVTALWNDGIRYANDYRRERGYYPNKYTLQEALRNTPSYKNINSDIAKTTTETLATSLNNAMHNGTKSPREKHPQKPTTIQINANRNYITTNKPNIIIPGTRCHKKQPNETKQEYQKRREQYLKEQEYRQLPKPKNLTDEQLNNAKGFQIVFHKGQYISLNIQTIKPTTTQETINKTKNNKNTNTEETHNETRVMTIDLGIDNLATCTSFDIGEGTEDILDCFLVDGRAIKSWNKTYNAHKAELQEAVDFVLSDVADNHALTRKNRLWGVIRCLGDKRDCRIDWYLRSAASRIIDRCLKHKVECVYCGWNEGFKQRLGMGRVGNQRFACVPLARFRDFLMICCLSHGIGFETVDESYTSKSSALSLDPLPSFSDVSSGVVERPVFSGFRGRFVQGKRKKRVRKYYRGVFSACIGGRWIELNSDVNATLNLLRRCRLGTFERVLARLGVTGVLGAVSRPERVMIVSHDKVSNEAQRKHDSKVSAGTGGTTGSAKYQFSWTSKAMHIRSKMYNPK